MSSIEIKLPPFTEESAMVMHLGMFLCMSVSLSVSLSVCRSVSLSVCLPLCPDAKLKKYCFDWLEFYFKSNIPVPRSSSNTIRMGIGIWTQVLSKVFVIKICRKSTSRRQTYVVVKTCASWRPRNCHLWLPCSQLSSPKYYHHIVHLPNTLTQKCSLLQGFLMEMLCT